MHNLVIYLPFQKGYMIQHKILFQKPPHQHKLLHPNFQKLENFFHVRNCRFSNRQYPYSTKYSRTKQSSSCDGYCTSLYPEREYLPEVIFLHHNVHTKLKSQAGFVRKSVVLFASLYIYHGKVRRDDLMKYVTENYGPQTFEI